MPPFSPENSEDTGKSKTRAMKNLIKIVFLIVLFLLVVTDLLPFVGSNGQMIASRMSVPVPSMSASSTR